MAYTITLDRVLSCLSVALVNGEKYQITIGTHVTTTEYLSHKKALVKDVSKYVDRVSGKMPTCVLIEFKDFQLVLIIDQLSDMILGTGLTFKYATYDVRIECV